MYFEKKVVVKATIVEGSITSATSSGGSLLHSPKLLFPYHEGKSGHLWLKYSDWVLQRVKEIHHVLGVSCVSFEEQFMAILTVIAASCLPKGSGSISKLSIKCNRELKRFFLIRQ